VYFDYEPCSVCGSEVRVRARRASDPDHGPDPDGTIDVRVCQNPDCATNSGADGTPTP